MNLLNKIKLKFNSNKNQYNNSKKRIISMILILLITNKIKQLNKLLQPNKILQPIKILQLNKIR